MSDKKQTAVEWQFDELQKAEKDWRNEAIDGKEYNERKYLILKQSKEMEKQQIIEAWIAEDSPLQRLRAEQYYNETYER
jgi:hypothetical protein